MILQGKTIQNFIIDFKIGPDDCAYRDMYVAHTFNIDDDGPCDVFLTVYAVDDMPKCMDKEHIREFEIYRQVKDDCFPIYLDEGCTEVDGKRFAWMTTEYVPFRTLTDWMIKNDFNIDENEVLDLFCDVLDGVKELACLLPNGGYFNLNPNNVIVSDMPSAAGRKSQAYLLGLAHASESCSGNPRFDIKTIDGNYRAKETILGRFATASDIYSLGLLLGFFLNGTFPFDIDLCATSKKVLEQVATGKLPSFIPEGLQTIIYKAISTKVSNRYQSIAEFRHAIKVYRGEETNEDETSEEDEKERVMRSRQMAMARYSMNPEETADDVCPEPHVKVDIQQKTGEGFSAVAGMEPIKKMLQRDYVDVMTNPDIAKMYGIHIPNILLYGPPGTGKTYLSMRLAEECGMECSVVNPSDLGSIYIHGSQTMIKDLFENAAKQAKKNGKGVLIIFDEFDALCPIRTADDRNSQAGEVAELLVQLNNCHEKNIFVIGTTNCLDRIDKAIIRKGRIDEVIYVGMPDEGCRKQLFEYELTKCPHEDSIDLNKLVKMTDGFSSSDITYLVKESARNSFEACLKNEDKHIVKIDQDMLERVIRNTRPSVSTADIRHYEQMRDEMINSRSNNRPRIGFR